MATQLHPETEAVIGGKSRQLRWDKAALYELGAYPEASKEVDPDDGPALWRHACIWAFCMIVGRNPYKSPKELAAELKEDEIEPLMTAITESIQAANGEGDVDDDPLGNGHSQEGD